MAVSPCCKLSKSSKPRWHLCSRLKVPTDLAGNLAFRKKLLKLAQTNFEWKRRLWHLCANDIHWWINCFCFTYDPRREEDQKEIPFIEWPFQTDAIDIIQEHIGKSDLFIDKSRDMGATWMVLIVFLWFWIFHRHNSFTLISRKADMVEKAGDTDTLFWKIDFILNRLPSWMRPNLTDIDLNMTNNDNGSVMSGTATTSDAGVGGRRTACFYDEGSRMEEFADIWNGTKDVTKSRIICGTPWGAGGKFAEIHRSKIDKLRLHWCLHPEKNVGLYHGPHPFTKKADCERSPWYDKECDERDQQDVAQNLDIDYLSTGAPFFGPGILDELEAECEPPLGRYRVVLDLETCTVKELVPDTRGELALWFLLRAGRPPQGDYWMGGDISWGKGISNSVLAIADEVLRKQVASFVSPYLTPEDFARYAVALCRFFYEAMLIHEANGPGYTFTRKVIDSGYKRLWRRYKAEDVIVREIDPNKVGWYSTDDSKTELLSTYRESLRLKNFIQPDKEAINECREYVFVTGNRVAHQKSLSSADPSGAEKGHGDRVIASALLVRGMPKKEAVAEKKKAQLTYGSDAARAFFVGDDPRNPRVPYELQEQMTLRHRMQMYEQAQKKEEDGDRPDEPFGLQTTG